MCAEQQGSGDSGYGGAWCRHGVWKLFGFKTMRVGWPAVQAAWDESPPGCDGTILLDLFSRVRNY
jgi:hypothetical protein